jgi:hypothetical protein
MEIEFNTRRIPTAESSPTVTRRSDPSAATEAVSFAASDSLKSQLNNLSASRPEQVAKAKALAADGKYPPDDVLDRMAVLLAIHNGASSPGPSDSLS